MSGDWLPPIPGTEQPGTTESHLTRHDGDAPRPAVRPTRHELDGGADATAGHGTRRDGPPGDDDFVGVNLFPPLADDYEIVRELRSGAEASVLLVTDRKGEHFVVKQYAPSFAPDAQAFQLLSDANRAHVVEAIRGDYYASRWWEVLEWCRFGALREAPDPREMPGPNDVRGSDGVVRGIDVDVLIREVAAALTHVHSLGTGLVHCDLKPENVFVRSMGAQPDLVLGDFGVVKQLHDNATVRWTKAALTPGYEPPEASAGEVTAAWDWWSLGVMIVEWVTGHHPFEHLGNDPRLITSELAQRAVDVSGVTDARLNLLCRGLLTRDRHQRWGAAEVEAWMSGESPAVAADTWAPPRVIGLQVTFAGETYRDPRTLAAALQRSWDEAQRRYIQAPEPAAVEDLKDFLVAASLTEGVTVLDAPLSAGNTPPRKLAKLLAVMDATLSPRFKGVNLTPEGLLDALDAAGWQGEIAASLTEIRTNSLLSLWNDLPGCEGNAVRADEWSELVKAYEAALVPLQEQGVVEPGSAGAAERDLLRIVLDPDEVGRLRALITSDQRRLALAQRQPWFQEIHRVAADSPSPVPTLLAARLVGPAADGSRAQDAAAERQGQEERAALEREARRVAAEAARTDAIRSLESQRDALARHAPTTAGAGSVLFATLVAAVGGFALGNVNGDDGTAKLTAAIAAVVTFVSVRGWTTHRRRRRGAARGQTDTEVLNQRIGELQAAPWEQLMRPNGRPGGDLFRPPALSSGGRPVAWLVVLGVALFALAAVAPRLSAGRAEDGSVVPLLQPPTPLTPGSSAALASLLRPFSSPQSDVVVASWLSVALAAAVLLCLVTLPASWNGRYVRAVGALLICLALATATFIVHDPFGIVPDDAVPRLVARHAVLGLLLPGLAFIVAGLVGIRRPGNSEHQTGRRLATIGAAVAIGLAFAVTDTVAFDAPERANPRALPGTTATTAAPATSPPTPTRVAPAGILTDCSSFDPAVGSAPSALLAQLTDDLASTGLACDGDASGREMAFSFATPVVLTQIGLRPAFIPAGSPESDTGSMRRVTSARWDCTGADGQLLGSLSQTFGDGTLQIIPTQGAFSACSAVALTILATAPGQGFDATPVTEVWFGA